MKPRLLVEKPKWLKDLEQLGENNTDQREKDLIATLKTRLLSLGLIQLRPDNKPSESRAKGAIVLKGTKTTQQKRGSESRLYECGKLGNGTAKRPRHWDNSHGAQALTCSLVTQPVEEDKGKVVLVN